MLLSLLFSGLVFASEPFPLSPLPTQWQLPQAAVHLELNHGPEKPPPDDGYEFKSQKNNGSKIAKIGFVMVCAGGITAVRMLSAPEGSDLRQQRAITSAALGGTGAGLIIWVRLR